MLLPRYLTSRKGGPKQPPPSVREAFLCPTCGEPLEFAQSMWVCPKGFHSKALTHGTLIQKLEELMAAHGYQRWTAEGIWYIQKQVQRWRRKNQADLERLGKLNAQLELAKKEAK